MALIHSEQTDDLFRAVLSLRSVEECYRFFEDLCTVKEVLALSQRMEVARLLRAGGTYHETIAGTGASSATLTAMLFATVRIVPSFGFMTAL